MGTLSVSERLQARRNRWRDRTKDLGPWRPRATRSGLAAPLMRLLARGLERPPVVQEAGSTGPTPGWAEREAPRAAGAGSGPRAVGLVLAGSSPPAPGAPRVGAEHRAEARGAGLRASNPAVSEGVVPRPPGSGPPGGRAWSGPIAGVPRASRIAAGPGPLVWRVGASPGQPEALGSVGPPGPAPAPVVVGPLGEGMALEALVEALRRDLLDSVLRELQDIQWRGEDPDGPDVWF